MAKPPLQTQNGEDVKEGIKESKEEEKPLEESKALEEVTAEKEPEVNTPIKTDKPSQEIKVEAVEEECQAEYKPLVTLKEVKKETGEEQEEVLFEQ